MDIVEKLKRIDSSIMAINKIIKESDVDTWMFSDAVDAITFLNEYKEVLKTKDEYRKKVIIEYDTRENVYDYFSSVDISISLIVSKNVWTHEDIIKKIKNYFTKDLSREIVIRNCEQYFHYCVQENDSEIGIPLKSIFEKLSKKEYAIKDLGSDTEMYTFTFEIGQRDELPEEGEE